MKHLILSSVTVAAALAGLQVKGQMVVYDNWAPTGWNVAYPTATGSNTDEFGDQVTLANDLPQWVKTFSLQYYSSNLSGQEQIRVRFYSNDGSPNDQGAAIPIRMLYDSGNIPIPTGNGAAALDLRNLNVEVPGTFTWTVQFLGISGSEKAGIALHGPASVGSSYKDFWERDDGPWELFQFSDSGLAGSFGARITGEAAVVPEPTHGSFLISLGLASLVLIRKGWAGRVRRRC